MNLSNFLQIKVRRGYFISNSYRFLATKIDSAKWKSVIGLEVHAQINSKSKLFSGATNKFASKINNNVALFDAAIPGTLPVLNKKCVEAAAIAALALKCQINPVSMFDRKHYFYADLPTGYQITQQRMPLAVNGCLEFEVLKSNKQPYMSKARIKQIQLEQDSGKSVHEEDRSLVDLNRAGAPLIEIVFEPDLEDSEQAAALVKELIIILQRIGTCTGKMEEGALRVDANVSVHKLGEPLGVRTEVKNIGSVGGIVGAIKYEIQRQIDVLESGGSVTNETRSWNVNHNMTVAMRDKEEVQDYRYMPEPNLPPLHVALHPLQNGDIKIFELQKKIPELPDETRKRLRDDFHLTREQSIILVNNVQLLQMFEDATKLNNNYTLIANLIMNDFLTLHNKDEKFCLGGDVMAQISELITNETINKNISKILLNEIYQGDKDNILKIIEKNNLMQLNDDSVIKEFCAAVINDNQKTVGDYRSGKEKVFKALLGKVYEKSEKKVNMNKATQILKEMLQNA